MASISYPGRSLTLIQKLKGKSFNDFLLIARNQVSRFVLNKLPRFTFPFIKSTIRLNGVKVSFMTHSRDRLLGGRLRREVNKDLPFLGELKLLMDTISPKSTVLDAGANIGAVAIVLAKVQPSASIYCFEPESLNYALLNINITMNHVENVSCFNFALARKEDIIRIYKSKDNFGDHRSVKSIMNDLGESEFTVSKNLVKKVNLRKFFSNRHSFQEPVIFDLLKIDTQGADFEILETSLSLLAKEATVAIELSPYHLYTNGTTKKKVLETCKHFKRISRICATTDGYRLEELTIRQISEYYENNYRKYRGYMDLVLRTY